MPVAIKAENISKMYQLGQISAGALVHDIERWVSKLRGKGDPFLKVGEVNDRTTAGESNVVWSLKDVNFEIEQGDTFGIIGNNGAGKSTLLKVISRVTNPTSGRITGLGRIASLLEVGTGFHPELTGKENVFLNGAILGMRKQEIARKFEEIVDFAGVERYIDTPVKRYSSGMYVRLAFAVAAHLDSEILILDEVLSVGDVGFQKKCMQKMRDINHKEGRTILFVGHNMASLRQLCNKGMILVNGQAGPVEPIDKCISAYLNIYDRESKKIKEKMRYYTHLVKIDDVIVNDSEFDNFQFSTDDLKIQVRLTGHVEDTLKLSMYLKIFDHQGIPLAFYSPAHEFGVVPVFQPGAFSITEQFALPSRMNKGRYFVSLSIGDGGTVNYMEIERAFYFEYDGVPTATGHAVEYTGGVGWLFLNSEARA